MPVGITIMKWDERIGAEVLIKYPGELVITDKTLMQIYSTHEYNQEAGMISMMIGPSTIASYFTGTEHNIYVILVLTIDEDPDVFEDGLADISRIILQNMEDDAFKNIIPSLFQRVSVYPTLDISQKLMMIYSDETKRILLKRLQEEGSVSKSEVGVWLKDKYKTDFVDLDSVITSFIKMGIVKESSVKGVISETLFLTNDIMLYRIPAADIVKDPHDRGLPEPLVEEYLAETKNFLNGYTPKEEDNLILIELFLDPEIYETIKLLRTAIVTRDDLEKLKKKGVEDMDKVLKKLYDANVVSVLQDEHGNEYYGLKSDLKIRRYFPEQILNIIRQDFNDKVKNNEVLKEHLTVLEEEYLSSSI